MRQILFWIHADSLFSFAPIGGVAAVGFIVPVLAWVAYSLGFGWWQARRPDAPAGIWKNALTSAGVGAAVSACVPFVLGNAIRPGIPVYGYGLMVFLGFVSGGWLASRRAPSRGIAPETIWDLLTWFFVAGIGGARLFFLIQYADIVYRPEMSLGQRVFATFNLSGGGLVLFGGVLAVVGAMFVFCRRNRLSPLVLGDVIVPSFFVGLAFGRTGCLLNGCCYGEPCTWPWGIQFAQGSVTHTALVARGYLEADAAFTYPLHPTQVYSAINAAMLAWFTSAVFRSKPPHGAVLAIALLIYPLTRFVLEILRGDEPGRFGTGLTISQLVGLGVSAAGMILLITVFARRPGKFDTAPDRAAVAT